MQHLNEKIGYFLENILSSDSIAIEMWYQDANLRKWIRGEIIDPDLSMSEMGAFVVDNLLYLHILIILTTKNLPLIASFLKNNPRVFGLAENLDQEKVTTLYLQLTIDFSQFSVTHDSLSIANNFILYCLSQYQETAAVQAIPLINIEYTETPPPTVPLSRFYRLIELDKNEALKLWNDSQELRSWFWGGNVAFDGKIYQPTISTLQKQIEFLMIKKYWNLVLFVIEKSPYLKNGLSALEKEASQKLLQKAIKFSNHKNLMDYLNKDIHTPNCVFECLKEAKNNNNNDAIYVLTCYIKNKKFHHLLKEFSDQSNSSYNKMNSKIKAKHKRNKPYSIPEFTENPSPKTSPVIETTPSFFPRVNSFALETNVDPLLIEKPSQPESQSTGQTELHQKNMMSETDIELLKEIFVPFQLKLM